MRCRMDTNGVRAGAVYFPTLIYPIKNIDTGNPIVAFAGVE